MLWRMGEGISNSSRKHMRCGMVWSSLWRCSWGVVWCNEGVGWCHEDQKLAVHCRLQKGPNNFKKCTALIKLNRYILLCKAKFLHHTNVRHPG